MIYNICILIVVLLVILLFLVRNNLIISCDGLIKYGLNIYIDFFEINCFCICIVFFFFVGKLFVINR